MDASKLREKFSAPSVENDGYTDASKHAPKESNIRTLMNVVKGNVGPGCLSLPYAFSHVGYYLGAPLILLLGAFTLTGWLMLLRCKQRLAGDLPLSYGDVTARAFGPIGRSAVNFFVMLTQLGICSVYFSFIATNLNAVLPGGLAFASMRHLILLQLPFLIALGSITDLRNITPLSVAANLFLFLGLIIVIGYDARNLEHPQSDRSASTCSVQGIAIYFGNAIYSFEGIGIILPIENEMAKPQDYPRILMVAMFIIGIVFSVVGELTLSSFGTITEGSATAEIALFYKNEWPVVLCNVCLIIAVAFTFPIQFFPAIQIAEANLLGIGTGHDIIDTLPSNADKREQPEDGRHTKIISDTVTLTTPQPSETRALLANGGNGTSKRIYHLRLLLRWTTITGCALFAYCVPNLGLLISLLGSVGSTVLALLLPALLYWKLMKPSFAAKCGLAMLLALGLVCGGTSFVVAIMQLAEGGGG
jgi:proton-coupled amino acid transporter